MKSILSFKLNKKFVLKKTLFFLFLCFYSTLFSQSPCDCSKVTSSADPCPTPTLYPSLTAAVNAPINGTVFSPALSFSTTSQTYTFCTRYTVPTGVTSIGLVNFTTAEDLISSPRQNVNFSRVAWTAYEITGCTSPINGATVATTGGGAAVFSVTPGKTYKFCVTIKATTNNPNGIVSSTELYIYNATPASTGCSACNNASCPVGNVPTYEDRWPFGDNPPCSIQSASLNLNCPGVGAKNCNSGLSITGTYTTFQIVKADAQGFLGTYVQDVRTSSATNPFTVTSKLYASCGGSVIPTSNFNTLTGTTDNVHNRPGSVGAWNPEWSNLTPNGTYTLQTIFNIGTQTLTNYCMDYYGKVVSASVTPCGTVGFDWKSPQTNTPPANNKFTTCQNTDYELKADIKATAVEFIAPGIGIDDGGTISFSKIEIAEGAGATFVNAATTVNFTYLAPSYEYKFRLTGTGTGTVSLIDHATGTVLYSGAFTSGMVVTIAPGTIKGTATFSGPGVSNYKLNSPTYLASGYAIFNPSVAGDGVHTITYKWNNSNGDCGTAIKTVTVSGCSTPPATITACSTCSAASCPVVSVTATSFTLGQTSITSALTAADNQFLPNTISLNNNQSKTICVPVTVPNGATGLGFKQKLNVNILFCPTQGVTYQLRPKGNCASAPIAPNRTNAQPVASGFNPEWDNITPGDYVLCYTVTNDDCDPGKSFDVFGLGYYVVSTTSTSCNASVGTFTIKKNGTTATGTSFDLLPNEQLELISNNDFVTPPKAGADAAGLGYAVFKCNPSSFNLANKATFATATNSCFAGFHYAKDYTDINDGTSANSGGVQLGGLTTFWMVPVTFDDICSPTRATATCKTGDTNIGIDIDGDNCFKAGTPIQINYVLPAPSYTCGTVDFFAETIPATPSGTASPVSNFTFSCNSPSISLVANDPPSISIPNQWIYPGFILYVKPQTTWGASVNIDFYLNGVFAFSANPLTLLLNANLTNTDIFVWPVTFAQPGTYSFKITGTGTKKFDYIMYNAADGTIADQNTFSSTLTQTQTKFPIGTAHFSGPGVIDDVDNGGKGFFNPSAAGPGKHTITYSWNNGKSCVGTKTLEVTVSGPTVSVTSASVCPGNSAVLSASGATSYTWSTGATSSTVSVSPSSTTNYTVVGGGSGCTSTKIATVTLNATPTTTATTTGSLTCSTNTVQLNSTLSGLTYTWTAPSGGSVSSTNAQSTAASLAAGIYTLSVKNIAGCVYTTTTAVAQNTTTPSLSAGPSGTLTCGTKSITLSGSISSPTNASLSWAGQNVCGSVSSATSTACAAGIYTLTATSPINGCKSTSTVEVFSDASVPTVTISSATLELDCNKPTQTATITSTSTGLTYSWNPSPASGGSAAIASFSNSTTYTCVVTNSISCSTDVKVTVTSNTTVPTTSITVLGDLTCVPGSSVHLNAVNNFTTALNYTWTAQSIGSILTNVNTTTVAVNSAGNYSLSVVNPANGCSYTSTAVVNSNTATPTILFSANPMSGTAPLEVNFTNQSSGATDYSWNFGNNSTLTTTQTINPASTFTTVGTYTVELNGTDAVSGCQSSYRLIIEVIEGSSLEVPNVFTPNEDGANDVFKIICTGITELSCEIYNRWGTKVYEITSAGDSWDGAENSAGTYFYILNAKGKDAKEYSSKGFITMFK